MRLQNKVALITGASQGIGEATAKLLKKEGATVIISDVQTAKGQGLASKIKADFYELDVAIESNWQKVAAYIADKYQRLDVLFNNAGIIGLDEKYIPQDPEHLSLAAWQEINKINLDSVFFGCKYAIKLMKQQGGSIINIVILPRDAWV